ncbi:MAG TPA: glutamate--tRNA ligase family protein [Verrucomicrobiae bacterium]|nr:glutamate--tRNA ligase family protein [Verrucomicrobiae bacterium]
MGSNVRVRFAPSPTGYLHIGGARTALFNWLYARHTGGTFVLRVEDTDLERSTREATDVILTGLNWLGLNWDEGPYFQSERKEIYRKRVDELIAKGMAYEREGAIWFKMTKEPIVIPDVVIGNVRRELTDREMDDPDFVLIRSKGEAVFHFTNVVDDIEMKITHVIRGEDHVSNTAKHIALYRAFGVEPPKFAHIPLILNLDGSKMSKRDQGASLSTYMHEGYAPEAVVNYLCLLGWSPKDNREKMSLDEVVQRFDLPQILRHNARFDMKKLQWLNGEYIRSMEKERFHKFGIEALQKGGIDIPSFPAQYVKAALDTCQEKVKLLTDIPPFIDFYFRDVTEYDPEGLKHFTADNKPRFQRLRDAFAKLSTFDAASLEAALKSVAAELNVKPAVLVHPLRLACTGKSIGPSLYHLMEILGREKVLERIDRALAKF